MSVIEYSGVKIEVDDDGYLVNPDDWNETVACALAEREGIEELTKERMEIIKFIRDYYREFNHFPMLRSVCKNVHQPNKCVYEQFIEPIKTWKIAGLPKPDELVLGYLQYKQVPT